MTPHPFDNFRACKVALRRPLSQILGTEAARLREKSVPHVRGHETRREKVRDLALAMARAMGRA